MNELGVEFEVFDPDFGDGVELLHGVCDVVVVFYCVAQAGWKPAFFAGVGAVVEPGWSAAESATAVAPLFSPVAEALFDLAVAVLVLVGAYDCSGKAIVGFPCYGDSAGPAWVEVEDHGLGDGVGCIYVVELDSEDALDPDLGSAAGFEPASYP